VLLVGALTACYGSLIAATQTDIKRLLAYSTMSHCGFLFICVYFNYFYLTISYLFLHGLFKASTFFCAGSFIRVFNTQDTRVMGSGARFAYFDSTLLVVCAVNLGGLPLSMGYAYKIIILQLLHAQPVSPFILGCIFLGLVLSLIYTFQLIYYAVFDYYKGEHSVLPLYSQLSAITFVEFYRTTTPAQLLAQMIIYVFIIVFYFFSQCLAEAAFSALVVEDVAANFFSLLVFMPLEISAVLILFY
jgi:NADH:ubiquinone oxidoreductase subunit 5 (subunit L)/multisubunit Na+/H+ antiporter MnhA subunit